MRKLLKFLFGLLGLLLLAAGVVWGLAEYRVSSAGARLYSVNDPPLSVPTDAESLALGRHLYVTRGCGDCHGENGEGKLVFDAGPVIKLIAPNLTPGGSGALAADQLAAAIRHGVRADGTPLRFMPSGDFRNMSDSDVAALIAHLKSLPPSDNQPGDTEVRIMAKVMYLFGEFPLYAAETIDHAPRARSAPPLAATVEYGAYLAQGCTGCHGADFRGGHIPGTPPDFPDAANITAAALQGWTQDQFRTAMRTGKRPDGRVLNELMPWKVFAQLKDEEVDALWLYLSTAPPAR